MKVLKFTLVSGLFVMSMLLSSVVEGRLAKEADIMLLKTDLLTGRIEIGKTRLKSVKSTYGDAASITDSPKKLTYNYGDLKIVF